MGTELAKVIEVQRKGLQISVKIDDEEFPWYITEGGLSLGVSKDEMPTVTLTVLAEDVRVVNRLDPDA